MDVKEERRRDEMKIRYFRYGFHRVTEAIPQEMCAKCIEPIHGESIKINTRIFHPNCYVESRRETD